MELQPNKLEEAINSDDHTTDVVPLSERRGPILLGLLWITMVTGFPSVLAGFYWFKSGLTLSQVLLCSLISNAILMAYSIPSCHLGAVSGQTYALMSRALFGKLGSIFVSLNVSWISIAWYGLAAVLLANGLKGVFNIPIDTMWLSVLLAFIMSVNNLFGFSGVANFAGYLAAPVLIIWIGMTSFKAAMSTPVAAFSAPETVAFAPALTVVSALIIGNSAWGNEADYWRYAKPKLSLTVAPLVVSVAIGQIVFPITGWLLARETGITDFEAASGLMTRYAFSGWGIATALAALVLVVTYWGLNDANLYASINGMANLKKFSRKKLTIVLTCLGAIAAAFLSHNSKALETVCSVSSTVLPCATIIMLTEWAFAIRDKKQPFFTRVPTFAELPLIRWSAVIAFAAGSIVGIATAGIIDGLLFLQMGVSSVQAWITAFIIYAILRPMDPLVRRSLEPADEVFSGDRIGTPTETH